MEQHNLCICRRGLEWPRWVDFFSCEDMMKDIIFTLRGCSLNPIFKNQHGCDLWNYPNHISQRTSELGQKGEWAFLTGSPGFGPGSDRLFATVWKLNLKCRNMLTQICSLLLSLSVFLFSCLLLCVFRVRYGQAAPLISVSTSHLWGQSFNPLAGVVHFAHINMWQIYAGGLLSLPFATAQVDWTTEGHWVGVRVRVRVRVRERERELPWLRWQ